MDKLKKILSPGHEKDDELMYGTQSSSPSSAATTGKQTGQGTHFGSTKGAGEPSSTPQSATGTSTTATGTSSGPYSSMADTQAEPASRNTTGEAAIGQTSTYGKYSLGTGETTSSVIDPTSSDPRTYQKPEKDYEGHNRATSTGVPEGAAASAASAAYGHHQGTTAASTEPHVATAKSTDLNSSLGAGPEPYSAQTGASGDTTHGISGAGAAGGAGLAGSAAGAARSGQTEKKINEGMPGAFPNDDYVNPYKSTTPLDPRVDSIPRNFSKPTSGPPEAHIASTSGDSDINSSNTSSTIPTRTGPPPSHHRKESIPTTAYPSGAFSATPASPPRTQHRKESIPTTAYPSGSFSGSSPPAPAHMVGGQQSSASDTKDDHHYGRDAAAAAVGAGAIGAGVHEHDKNKYSGASAPSYEKAGGNIGDSGMGNFQRTNQPSSSYGAAEAAGVKEPHIGTRGNETAVSGGSSDKGPSAPFATGATALGGGYGYERREDSDRPRPGDKAPFANDPADSSTGWTQLTDAPMSTALADDTQSSQPKDSHKGRDAALVGAAGVGTAAVGGHEYSKYKDHKADDTQSSQPKESHKGRDAALVGAAGVGTAAVGGHEYSKYEDHKAEKERLDAEKAHEKALDEQRKEADKHAKEVEKQEKAAEKESLKEERKAHQAAVKEEKKADKEAAKEEARAQKEEKKVIATQEKEEAEEEKGEKKKHRSLFGFLKRRKNAKGEDEDYESENEDDHTGAKVAGVGAAGAVAGTAAYEATHHEHNKLHKDPPAGHPAAAGMGETSGTGPSGYSSAAPGIAASTPSYGDNSASYAEPPTKGYASQVTGGTGTTALAQGEGTYSGIAGSTQSHGGNYADPPTKGYASQVTGGTGTTALAQKERQTSASEKYASQVTGGTGTTTLAQGEQGPRGSHSIGAANVSDSKLGYRQTTDEEPVALSATKSSGFRDPSDPLKGPRDDPLLPSSSGEPIGSDIPYRTASGQVIEPITGLPVDLSKGDVAGGTDSGTMPSLKDRIFHRGSH